MEQVFCPSYIFDFHRYAEPVPNAWEWWVANVFASVVMASLGEYFCAMSELQDIPLYSDS
jgi:hypothetical protein